MPGPFPIDALKSYFAPGGSGTEQSPFAPWQKTGQDLVSGGVEGLKGLVIGPGDEAGPTVRNAGALAGAALPLANSPLLALKRALTDALEVGPGLARPAEQFLSERVGGHYIPHRAAIVPPPGFELPPDVGAGRFIARSPELIDEYANQRTAFLGQPLKQKQGQKIGSTPSWKSTEPGFQSKFSLTPEDQRYGSKKGPK